MNRREEARELRRHARALRRRADELCAEADELLRAQADAEGCMLLDGGTAVRLLCERLLAVGEELHYKVLLTRLQRAGYVPGGVDPAATLLTAISRHPEFQVTTHAGVYRRVGQ